MAFIGAFLSSRIQTELETEPDGVQVDPRFTRVGRAALNLC